MRMIVFTGSTLTHEAGREILPDATFRGPAGFGDVYRAWRDGASVIAIIDGTFDQAMAVWHKEILWALQEGVLVVGAASMGALRAAELDDFGMRGVGRIYRWFRDEELEDDDEVAVSHEPADGNYRARSEALVNIRVTLARARNQGVISATTAEMLGVLAKDLFYPERSYAEILRRARSLALPSSECDSLAGWLPRGRVDQKREDALSLLAELRDGTLVERSNEDPIAPFTFEYTAAWQLMRDRIDGPR
jgi:hypothetical protein